MGIREVFFNGREISNHEQIVVTQGEMEKAKKYQIKDVDFDVTKKGIDWAEIKRIFEEIAVKSGINPKDLNFVGPDNVLNCKATADGFGEGKEVIGRYSSLGNYVVLNSNQIRRIAQEKGVDASLMTLDTLIHELCHAVAHHTHTINRTFNNEFFSGKDEFAYVGAYRSSKDSNKIVFNQVVEKRRESIGDALDEAITEKMATGIFREYSKRTDLVDKNKLKSYEDNFHDDEKREYSKLVRFIEALCGVISDKTGIDKEIVWRGFVRGAFYKNTLHDPEIKEWFEQSFAPTFLSEIIGATEADELFKILEKYK